LKLTKIINGNIVESTLHYDVESIGYITAVNWISS